MRRVDPGITLYLCGAGNPEAVRLALRLNRAEPRWSRLVLLDDDPAKRGQTILGVQIRGAFSELESIGPEAAEVANLVARTTPKRWAVGRRLEAYGLPPATLIDASVDRLGTELDRELTVYQHAVVGAGASIGCASVIFMGAVVGHAATLGRCCIIGPHAVLNARVRLENGVYVGANATILPEVRVGAWATIAAGSVVMQDVPAGATVMGVPAKTLLTFKAKLRMGEFQYLPQALRRDLERQAL